VPDLRGGERGDQIVTVHVVTPRNLTPEQRALFEQLAETMGSEITQQPPHRTFFDKVKDALGV
jgi:molecular chaperone DnaJ